MAYHGRCKTGLTMTSTIRTRYDDKARFMKALAHPTRLFIVDELSLKPRCVCELVEKIGDDYSTVSRHLSVMKNAGIVRDEKKGNMVIYSLSVPCLRGFFACFDATQQARGAQVPELVEIPDVLL